MELESCGNRSFEFTDDVVKKMILIPFDGASWSIVVEEGEPVAYVGSRATTLSIRAMTSGAGGSTLAGVQISENNLDDLYSSREEDGTSETMDPQDLLGLGVSVSRAVGFLRGTSAVVVIIVKGHVFPTIVKVRPVGL
nr:hypothetical protein [Tanacetum cinerariifolium]